MKQYTRCIFVLLLTCTCLLSSCASSHPLDSQLTVQYELSDLDNYIKPGNPHKLDNSTFEWESLIFYNDLNAKYPVEILRICDNAYTAYSVYKITQGGYYYVFWTHAYPTEDMDSNATKIPDWSDTEHMCVYFSIYINSAQRSILRYLSIEPGASLEEIISMDPDLDRGITAFYHYYYYINKNYVLEVECTLGENYRGNLNSAKHILVSRVRIIPRNQSRGFLSRINDEDLP